MILYVYNHLEYMRTNWFLVKNFEFKISFGDIRKCSWSAIFIHIFYIYSHLSCFHVFKLLLNLLSHGSQFDTLDINRTLLILLASIAFCSRSIGWRILWAYSRIMSIHSFLRDVNFFSQSMKLDSFNLSFLRTNYNEKFGLCLFPLLPTMKRYG